MNNTLNKEKDVIAAMFNSIARNYDFLNHLLSFGIDTIWRRRLISVVKKSNPSNALDIACGTGDITISLARAGISVTGVDIAENMMLYARAKFNSISSKEKEIPQPCFICSPAESLPLEDSAYDLVTIGFGIRNFYDRDKALSEIRRVLRPDGELAILEFATPRNPVWNFIFKLYFLNILPFIGRIVSGSNHAYNYLPSSVEAFPQYKDFCKELENKGFKEINQKPLTGGIAVLYIARK